VNALRKGGSTILILMNAVAVLAVLGIVVSSVSLQHHFANSKTAYCDIGEAFSCDIVNRSQYSSILGIPVALVGMLGYGALAGLALLPLSTRALRSLVSCDDVLGRLRDAA